MKRQIIKLLPFALCTGVLVGCGGSDHQDLVEYMADVKARPSGQIEPIPEFTPYKPFDYGVAQMRGPFDRPVTIERIIEMLPASTVEPDFNRIKEYLEQVNLESLAMVGTIEQDSILWALVDDGSGNVHYVKEGNYLGKHHGRIMVVANSHLQVVEIISNGTDGWVERPRTLEMREE
ncbi:Uncharacterised protein [BD1-7 clade bacterium]|uniref:Pilus assembly protein PilP n=1 Tax=BD1-7 clade bacterium TaxID=2029982 RepID=A0A5S9MRZ1_9GAMM|nr:Uncharacterised protein [BD1-7 clade bacterium]CAA0085216.1 Uncharacterised protein [BD1-7 clade bacterium]